ncbi:uracil-DNA glycosylase [Pseudoduganella sp. UC29_106]|uniref:uracil-DNA glycosylase n=1 Tax=Pseudoduganella sp. UC29_106 TaxID=3374553 RepID=UPI003757AFBD
MSGLLPHRSAVFLDEMGVGVQWRLRNRPAAGYSAPVDAALADATPAPVTTVAAAVPPAQPAAQSAPPAAQPTPTPVSAPDAEWDGALAQARAAAPAPDAALEDAPAAAKPSAAAQAPDAARQPSPARTPAPESAWDDAPPVAPRPEAQPRPIAAAQPPAAAQARADADQADERQQSPKSDDAWFDDVPAAAAPVRRPALSGPVTDEEIAAMDWPTLQAAVKACTRCGLCETREAAVTGRGDEHATWLVLDSAPNADDEEYAEPITAKPGKLLDNMLRAVNQSTASGAYVTTLVKCRPSDDRAPTQEELQACRPYLQRELQLTQAKVIVALGHAAGKGLLGAAARGRIMMHGETPVVATFHPADLLNRPEEKAKAWADLCLAKSAHAGRR